MKLLALCAVFSVLLAVSLASPVKTKIHDESDSSESAESSELKQIDKNSSSSEEEAAQEIVKIFKNEENNEGDNSADSSEEHPDNITYDKEEVNERNSVAEDEERLLLELTDNNEILKNDHFDRFKRAVEFAPHNNNQLKVKDEGSIKYEKYLKLKRLRRSIESDESKDIQGMPPHILLRHERGADISDKDSSEENKQSKPDAAHELDPRRRRNTRSTESSEENSSEENKQSKHHDAHEHSVDIAKKPDTAPSETLELSAKPDTAPAESEPKPEDSRRKRNTRSAETSEENSSEEDEQNKRPSIVLAKKPDATPAETLELAAKPDTAPAESDPNPEGSRRRRNVDVSSEEDSKQDQDVNEVFIFSNEKQQDSEEKFENDQLKNNEYAILEDRSLEKGNKNSEEDYAQGCGGSDDDSSENSNEDNETAIDKL